MDSSGNKENPLGKPVWASSPHLESVHLMWQLNEGMGISAIKEDGDDQPKIIFCSLFDDPGKAFYEGLDLRSVGLTIDELRGALNKIEGMFNSNA